MNTALVSLHQSVLTLLLHEIHKGHYERCKAMGIPDGLIAIINAMSADQHSQLIYSTIEWFKLIPNIPVMLRIADNRPSQDERLMNQAIRAGASNEMMESCFGLHHTETAARRRALGVDVKLGRNPNLSEEETALVWNEWNSRNRIRRADATDERKTMIEIATETHLPLSCIWKELKTHGSALDWCDSQKGQDHESTRIFVPDEFELV